MKRDLDIQDLEGWISHSEQKREWDELLSQPGDLEGEPCSKVEDATLWILAVLGSVVWGVIGILLWPFIGRRS